MIPDTFIDYYGDQTRWFVGVVTNTEDDPLQIGRAQVRIHGIHDDEAIQDKHLPWAQIVVPVTHAVHEGKGQFLGMLVGTQVFGVFLDGKNSQLPLIVGSIPKEGDSNSRVKKFGEYPKNKVYATESGHYKEYDDTYAKERIREQHMLGGFTEMYTDENQKTSYVINVTGDCDIKVKGTANITGSEGVNIGGGPVSINGKKQ